MWSILPPWKVIRNSEGEGVFKAKLFKGKHAAKLEFPGGGGLKPKNLPLGEYEYFLEEHSSH